MATVSISCCTHTHTQRKKEKKNEVFKINNDNKNNVRGSFFLFTGCY